MKTFETLEDVIDNAITVHTLAAGLFRKLGVRAGEPRGQFLLEDMANHSDRMQKLIGEFKERTAPEALNTYIQYTLEEPPKAFISAVTPTRETLTVTDISQLGQEIHHYLVGLLEGVQREMGSSEAHELLRDLLQLEVAESHHLTTAANTAGDI